MKLVSGQRPYQYLFQRTDIPMYIVFPFVEVEYRIPDQLTGIMAGNVTSSVCSDNIRALRMKFGFAYTEIVLSTPASYGNHRHVLQKDEDAVPFPR
jgi:hypothetical protein